MSRTAGMLSVSGKVHHRPRCLAACLASITVLAAVAQPVGDPVTLSSEDFVTAQAAAAWDKWQLTMRALLAKDAEASENAFGELAALDPSPLRLALLAERTVQKTTDGGAVLLFEQDIEAGTLGENGRKIGEALLVGREQWNQADDGWYFAQIGRFDVSAANFRALLESDPDPVALLEFADRVKRRNEILLQLVTHPQLGESAKAILRLLGEGEWRIKADPGRIKDHIDRLAGPPRAFENGVARLKDSGEYAVPFIVQYLRDPSKKALMPALLKSLPQIDRAALNPLVMALRMNDQTTKRYIINALGQIPYPQSLPYLLKLAQDSSTPGDVKAVVDQALAALRARGVEFDPGAAAARMFHQLAEGYYADRGSLAADTTLEKANVWYWRNDMLVNVPVPTVVFNEIMTMRCCEEALLLDADARDSLALWLAANFRREAQLGDGVVDPTRPENYPSGLYFAQSAGPDYCLMALRRAIDDNDPAVAIGAIEALRRTGGAASVISGADGKLPLADALSFPNRMVRIRAALALGQANPTQQFHGYQNLVPVLAEALSLHGGSRNAIVVDPDENSANHFAGILRDDGYSVISAAGLSTALDRAKSDAPGLDVVVVASDVGDPGLEESLHRMREDFAYRAVPVLLISKPADRSLVRKLVRADHRVLDVAPGEDADRVRLAVARVSYAVGFHPITPEIGQAIALESAQTIHGLAVANSSVFDLKRAEAALVSTLEATKDAALRRTVAQVLEYYGSATAQEGIARLALSVDVDSDMRVSMFDSLAAAGRRRGNLLSAATVDALLKVVEAEPDMVLRTAASQALGALNLPGNKAGDLIRGQYGG